MKIGIIGAGNVGASCASLLISRNICKEISLIDINKNLAIARAIDLSHMASVLNMDTIIYGGDDYELLRDFDVVVITAGFARKAGQSREELALLNAKIVAQSSEKIAKLSQNSIIIVVTNPLDLMTHVALKASEFKPSKVIGMAGEIDSARLRYNIANKLGAKISQCEGMCVGMHNDSMICVESTMKFNGKPISDLFNLHNINEIKKATKSSGAKIVELIGTSAFYAPAAGILKMCEAIKNDSSNILNCSVFDENLIPTGRVVKLGKHGLKEIIEPNLNEVESNTLKENIYKLILSITKISK